MSNISYEKWMESSILKEIGDGEFTHESLKIYQLKKIRQTIDIAKKNRFYRETLKNISAVDIKSFDDIKKLPFTTYIDLENNPKDFICTPLEQISRIVTLKTSGTMGNPKRIAFTEKDLETTVNFFKFGMLNLVHPGQKVLILMPGSSPDSIGQLLKKGLNKAGCEGFVYGPVFNVWDALETMKSDHIDCIVGIPTQVYYLAKLKNTDARYQDIKLKSVLLSADHASKSLCDVVGHAFNCPVFTHYGMTEMGYGGGVECRALNGYHMRELDLYTEIINPKTGQNVEDGTYGEVVFTTLTREGMPLIRYRTGDISRFLPKNCDCSDIFKRLDYIEGRLSEFYPFENGTFLSIGMLDEIIFKLDNVLDYRATIHEKGDKTIIRLEIKPVLPDIPMNFGEIKTLISQDKRINLFLENNTIDIEVTGFRGPIEISNGMQKRKLYWEKGENSD